MSTNAEQDPKTPQNGRYDFLRKPCTYPENWDLSAISMPDHANSNDESDPKIQATNLLSENTQDEMSGDQVSFTDWQLSPHLDQFDKPEEDHFSAY